MFHNFVILYAEDIYLSLVLIQLAVIPIGFAEGRDKIALAYQQYDLTISEGRIGHGSELVEVFYAICHLGIVLNVGLLGDKFLNTLRVPAWHQGLLNQIADEGFVFFRLIQVYYLGRAVYGGMT